jgi:hypothetical protein
MDYQGDIHRALDKAEADALNAEGYHWRMIYYLIKAVIFALLMIADAIGRLPQDVEHGPKSA